MSPDVLQDLQFIYRQTAQNDSAKTWSGACQMYHERRAGLRGAGGVPCMLSHVCGHKASVLSFPPASHLPAHIWEHVRGARTEANELATSRLCCWVW